jgi:NUMOD4 motif/HNH endonuclease
MQFEQIEFLERWLPVVGYEGFYEVSNWGRVRSLARFKSGRMASGQLLVQMKKAGGYLGVCLFSPKRSQVYVAHLVAAAWLGTRPPGNDVDHKDGNKQNNVVWNLRYITHRENANAGNFKFKQEKLSDADVVEIRRLALEGMARKDIAKMFNASVGHIGKIIRKEKRVH